MPGRFKYIFLIFLLFLIISCKKESQTQDPYLFFVAGHTYGKPGQNNAGLYPPFTQKLMEIKDSMNISFGVLTGDVVIDPTKKDWDEVDSVISMLEIPIHIAVGNHDMRNRDLYEERYGKTYSSFLYKNDLFIILDPNLDGWNISGEQLDFLKSTLTNYTHQSEHIFVFFHQLLWFKPGTIYSEIKANSIEGKEGEINFWDEIIPLFTTFQRPVYMLAGDVGAMGYSKNYDEKTFENITFIASGMGNTIDDNFVVVEIDKTKNVSIEKIDF